MKKRVALVLTCLLAIFGLGGCRADVQDLRFESIETVRLSEFPGVWNAVQLRSNVKSDAIVLLKINFSSQFDLVKIAKSDTLHVSFRVFTCDGVGGQGLPLFTLPELRIKDFSVGDAAYSELPDLERFRDSNGRLTYHVLMPLAGRELNRIFGDGAIPGQSPNFTSTDPNADICLQVVAAAMWFGSTLRSNVMRIPGPQVSKLFAPIEK